MSIEQFLLERAKSEGLQKGKLEGILEGKLEGKLEAENFKNRHFTESLLRDSDFSIENIATMVGVTVAFVLQVKRELK